MSTSSNNHQANVKMRWERQERETAWAGKMVKELCVTTLQPKTKTPHKDVGKQCVFP